VRTNLDGPQWRAMTVTSKNDLDHMRHALVLAGRGLGEVAPNPAVGCVIVKDGVVIGRGRTARGGRPHAEPQALAEAGEAARGATAYVTLEPCSHHGHTAPCSKALIDAGVARVVVAVSDPDTRVNGEGIAWLRMAGVEVMTGICEHEAAELNAGFFLKVRHARPLVTLKLAQSLDGKIATATGDSRWITSEPARAYGHLLRAKHDAILIGVGTALADDPMLTCRLPGLEDRSPVRVVVDTRRRLPPWSQLAQTAGDIPTLVYTTSAEGGGALEVCGVEMIPVTRDVAGRPDLGAVLADLADRGFTRVLVEGGASIHAGFLNRGLADRLEVFSAPMILGGSGLSSVDSLAALSLNEAPQFVIAGVHPLGPDLLVSYARKD
jgi:diaminohydroxyphosphoribosylaminopyrimidine deaminase / 5-amino-6-(5-phosphoribosylamino)uracil reductase